MPTVEEHLKSVDTAELANYTTSAIKDTFLLALIAKVFDQEGTADLLKNILSDDYKEMLLNSVNTAILNSEKDADVADEVVSRLDTLIDSIFTKINEDFLAMIDGVRGELETP